MQFKKPIFICRPTYKLQIMDKQFWIRTIIIAFLLSILDGILAAEYDYEIASWHGTAILILAFAISTIIKKMNNHEI